MSTTTVVNRSKAGWRIPEWMADAGLSRSTTYELLAAGRIESVKVGASRIIITSPGDFLASLKRADVKKSQPEGPIL